MMMMMMIMITIIKIHIKVRDIPKLLLRPIPTTVRVYIIPSKPPKINPEKRPHMFPKISQNRQTDPSN